MGEEPARLLSNDLCTVVIKASGDQFSSPSVLDNKSKRHYVEVLYKFSLNTPQTEAIFAKSGLTELRFLDAQKFMVATTVISQSDLFANQEYYEYLWLEKSKYEAISAIEAVPLSGEILKQAKTRVETARKDVTEAMRKAHLDPKEKTRWVLTPEKEFHPTAAFELERKNDLQAINENIKKISALLKSPDADSLNHVNPNSASDKGREMNVSEEDAVKIDDSRQMNKRFTNEDVTKLLKETYDGAPTPISNDEQTEIDESVTH